MTNSEQLRRDRAKLIEDMRSMNAKAETENRDLNADEKAQYERMMADTISLKNRYERMESADQLAKDANEVRSIVDPVMNGRSNSKTARPLESAEYRTAFVETLFRSGFKQMDPQFRDLNTTTPGDGGYIVPVTLQTDIYKILGQQAGVRSLGARVTPTSARTTFPISTQVTGTWEPERDPYGNNADTDPTLSVFNASPRKYTMRTTISEELMNDSPINIEAFINTLFVDSFGQASDNAYVNGAGSGSNQPNGVFGGGTDVVVTSATTFTAAELVDWFHALPSQHRNAPKAGIITSDKAVGLWAGMSRDVDNGVFFEYSTVAGGKDTLFGKPIVTSPVVDTNYAANAEVAVIGNFDAFQIVDFTSYAGIQRLNELSALTGAIQIVARYATDSKVLDANAFRVLKLAAS